MAEKKAEAARMKKAGKHITLVCSRLDLPGGIERAVVNTANLFAEKGHPVHLLILDETAHSMYPLHPEISITHLPLHFGITPDGNMVSRKIRFFRDLSRFRRALNHLPATTLLTTEYPFSIAAVLSGFGRRGRIISWEHHHFHWLKRNRFWEKMYRLAYPKLDDIVCLNTAEAGYYTEMTRVSIIPNFILPAAQKPRNPGKTILTAGWLIPRKGTDMLLPVAAHILNRYPGWTWKLCGQGELEPLVTTFIKEQKLEGRLLLQNPGVTNMQQEYAEASLFVLPSRYEAFPMVLLEAMTAGIPCISFNCPTGPADIIRHEEDGLLVPPENTEALQAAVEKLVSNESLRNHMGEKAREHIQRFAPDEVYGLWLELLNRE